MKKILLLGASGSIGGQTLDIIDKYSDKFVLSAVSVGRRSEVLSQLLRKYKTIKHAYLIDKSLIKSLKKEFPGVYFYHGKNGLKQIAMKAQYDMCINALVGIAGLEPAYYVLKRGKILCLANKETLVTGGPLIQGLLDKYHGKLYPIDSEHVALSKCLSKVNRSDVKRLILTASGGALRDVDINELKNQKASDALKHPNWKMGDKITIDCATMMNKGFEVIEAYYLFDFPLENIDIIMHKESLVHSLIELNDGSFIVDYGKPDMHGPIEYAMFEGKIDFKVKHVKSLSELKDCHFSNFDPIRYPLVDVARNSLKNGGTSLVVLNAVNEVAVQLFLKDNIRYDHIVTLINNVLSSHTILMFPNLNEIKKIDYYAREISLLVAAKL